MIILEKSQSKLKLQIARKEKKRNYDGCMTFLK
jgi:hypothetical protein